MKIEVIKTDGTKTGRSVEISDEIFGIEPHEHVMWLAVKHYLANQRQGTAKTKEKSEVSGSTRKLHKQKGTGGARKGSIKSGTLRGGARVFGPQPRDYDFKFNAKEKDLARRSALSQKAKENNIFVVDEMTLPTHRTKEFAQVLKNIGCNRKSLVIANDANDNLKRAARNIKACTLVSTGGLNAYEVLKANNLVFTESSIKGMNK